MGEDSAIRRLSMLASGMVLSLAAHAQQIPGYPARVDAYDAREVAMLPRYCIHTQSFRERVPGGNNKAIIEGWYAELGQTFHAMHHYCWGLMKTNRALLLARDPGVRQFYLADSINEFDYVLRHAPDDFVLLPEILTKKGENLIRLGRGPLGMLELERAITLRPDYWPPYAHMSDYLKTTGNVPKAREMLERGLSLSPEAPGLRRRLAELDSGAKDRTGTPR